VVLGEYDDVGVGDAVAVYDDSHALGVKNGSDTPGELAGHGKHPAMHLRWHITDLINVLFWDDEQFPGTGLADGQKRQDVIILVNRAAR
jgi:hypothetical protein